MNYTNQVANCTRCGAPIFLPPAEEWLDGKPPQAAFTCGCQAAVEEQIRAAQQARMGLAAMQGRPLSGSGNPQAQAQP